MMTIQISEGSKREDKRVLQPGWAGVLTIEEAEYIASELAKDPKLRRQWGFRKRKRYPLVLIAEKAFLENPMEGRRLMQNQMAARIRRQSAQHGQNQRVGEAKVESLAK